MLSVTERDERHTLTHVDGGDQKFAAIPKKRDIFAEPRLTVAMISSLARGPGSPAHWADVRLFRTPFWCVRGPGGQDAFWRLARSLRRRSTAVRAITDTNEPRAAALVGGKRLLDGQPD